MSTRNTIIVVALLLLTAFQGWFLVSIPLIIIFTYYYSAAWLVPVALLIDGYFGALHTVPELTAYTLLWFIASELIKPHLLWQNTS